MRFILLLLKLLVFLALLGLAVRNSETVSVNYFLGWAWHVPLSLLIFVCFALGVGVGVAACTPRLLRTYRELRRLRQASPDGV